MIAAAKPRLSIIIPTLDEAAGIEAQLLALAPLRAQGVELIVVDGGSTDGSASLAGPHADQVLLGPPGRAVQMNCGARAAAAPALLFLHADTRLPRAAPQAVLAALVERQWGRFDVRITGRHPLLRVVAWAMNLRSRASGIATGDQAMFVRRAAFETAGGFPEIPLMEDLALSRRLRALGRPACLRLKVETSGLRWEAHGVVRTVLLMWRLRTAYWLGADPARLAVRYGHARSAP
jgi:rSAM/selenodomain-associated transferase 2